MNNNLYWNYISTLYHPTNLSDLFFESAYNSNSRSAGWYFRASQFTAGGGSRDPGRILARLVNPSKGLCFEEIEDARGYTEALSWNPGHASLAGNSWFYIRALCFSVKQLVAMSVVFSSRVSCPSRFYRWGSLFDTFRLINSKSKVFIINNLLALKIIIQIESDRMESDWLNLYFYLMQKLIRI